jgi:predicted DNA-binding transcriptional regulator YafY
MTNATHQSLRMTRADFKVAIAFEKPANILYTDSKGNTDWRVIEPHEVRESKDGQLFVIAMCRTRGERRHFRLDRISHYTLERPGFIMELPRKVVDPEEITDWWTIRSANDHEIIQVELNTDGTVNPYAKVLAKATAESGKVRAVIKAERGVSIRRLRQKDVLAWR